MSSVTKNNRFNYVEENIELRRGPWTLEEDTLLIHYIACHGEGRWDMLAKCSGLKRTGKSCRLRWLNYLKPDVKRGNLTLEEQILILDLHSKWGNRWSRIAQHLPGRTDNEIKNYWRTRVQKQAKQLKINENSVKFRDAIEWLWMPRLLQKMEKSSPSSSSLTINSQSTSLVPLKLNQTPQASTSQAPQPLQGSLSTSEPVKSFNHQENNSTSENCTSPSITSSDSMNMSQLPEISEYPTSPHAFGNIVYNPFMKGCYHMDGSNYEMDDFNLTSISDCHMVESNWVDDEMSDSLWKMDELWQFRKLQ